MANLLDKFQDNVIGSDGTIYDYDDIITSSGDFRRNSKLAVILKSWNNILLTQVRSFTFDPEYGSELFKYVFEPADEITKQAIKDEIQIRLQYYDDRAQVSSIEVEFLPNKKGFVFQIEVLYAGEKGDFTSIINEDLYSKI